MTKDGQLNESSTKREIENRFSNACRAYYGMTWDEHERLHGEKGGENDEAKNQSAAADPNGR